MKTSLRKGFSFGLASSMITTLGLIVGLHAGTHSRTVVIGGILTIAIADAASDALAMHISEESENHHTTKQIWAATFSTFLSKLFFALTFVIPVLLLNLDTAIIVSIIWGIVLISLLSYNIAVSQKNNPAKVISEHLVISVLVIVAAHYVGYFVGIFF